MFLRAIWPNYSTTNLSLQRLAVLHKINK